ncbi:hypothetical protein F441_14073 [Phytophthora nicotianae CJ01A1]|uniref:Uncharacterized protein n=1 Tax=Phytophthora nicotianae CJ01A1 TaxID=1317063 RepID=W2WI52_PHYNI|nr:hypothetical protein F441_14073 [Phytophthora nicotianae CJ01A1]
MIYLQTTPDYDYGYDYNYIYDYNYDHDSDYDYDYDYDYYYDYDDEGLDIGGYRSARTTRKRQDFEGPDRLGFGSYRSASTTRKRPSLWNCLPKGKHNAQAGLVLISEKPAHHDKEVVFPDDIKLQSLESQKLRASMNTVSSTGSSQSMFALYKRLAEYPDLVPDPLENPKYDSSHVLLYSSRLREEIVLSQCQTINPPPFSQQYGPH